MENFSRLKKLGEISLVVCIVILSICRKILAVFGVVLILVSIFVIKGEIEYAQIPTEVVEVPPGIRVTYLNIGGWLLWQDFVIVHPPGLFGDSNEWIRTYDKEHPLDPEKVRQILEKEKRAKTHLGADKYTEEQKKDNRVAYERTFYRESSLTPRDWDGKEHDDSYKYREHILMYRSGFVEGFDKVEWIIKEEAGE